MKTVQSDDAWLQAKLAFEDDPQNAVVVSTELVKPHRLVAAAAKEVSIHRAALDRSRERLANPRQLKLGERWKPEIHTGPSWREYERRGRIMDLGPDTLPIRVSLDSADRALRIWDALLKACEARGIDVSLKNRVVEVAIGSDTVGLRLSEKVDQIERKTRSLADDRFTRLPTGRLRIFLEHLGPKKFEDTPERLIETQLNEVLRRVYRLIGAWRAAEPARAETAESARRQVAEIRRQQENQAATAAAKKQEVECQRALVAEAIAWREAHAIRDYVQHVKGAAASRSTRMELELQEWVKWATSVAATLDPTSTRLSNRCETAGGPLGPSIADRGSEKSPK